MDNQSNKRQQDNHMPAVDLGPLSWIRAPLHDVLSRVRKNLMHFSSQVDADATNPGSLNSLETTDLRLAERDLHDAVGVLNLVGYTATARIVAVMERCVQHFVSNPALCTPQAVGVLEQNINAVFDYLDSILNGTRPTRLVFSLPTANWHSSQGLSAYTLLTCGLTRGPGLKLPTNCNP